MGKLVSFITILIFVDMLFLITGQIVNFSPSSLVIGAILDPAGIQTSQWWLIIIGVAGIASLGVATGVISGFITVPAKFTAFVGMALIFALLLGDYLAISAYLRSFNPVLGTVIMAPMLMLFIFIVAEWMRDRD